jgi:hypothetical protein
MLRVTRSAPWSWHPMAKYTLPYYLERIVLVISHRR